MANQKTDDNQNKMKIGIAVGALAVASLLMAWNFGLFEPDPKKVAAQEEPLSPEQKVERKKQAEQAKEQYEKTKGTIPPQGS